MSSQASHIAVTRFERTIFMAFCREEMDINVYNFFAVLCINAYYQLLPELSNLWICYFKPPLLQPADALSFAYIYAIKQHFGFHCQG